ncbi:MAG: hypothetical protein LLG04_08675 [Parachlamydia sp.]|nr:hypothetical protein [Parachlamydia sp.]
MKSKIKLNTVNVIEMANGDFQSIRSFADTPEGDYAAEKLFRACILENGCEERDVESYIADGYFHLNDYSAFLAHSS